MIVPSIPWSPWYPLFGASGNKEIARLPGLYRIRRMGRPDLDYIGQTGLRLGQRLGALASALADEMPYRDPHTAAPALWALRHAERCSFEISVAVVEGTTPWRKGMEALAIGLYRQQHGRSPTVEFGRMPIGYRASTPNNSRLVKLGMRYRGGPTVDQDLASHILGVPPKGPLAGPPQSLDWIGHAWSEWRPLAAVSNHRRPIGVGLYRVRGDAQDTLLYIGQGKIPARPRAHFAKINEPSHSQGAIFRSSDRLECSWVLNDDWKSHHRLELENDLIAAHLIATGTIPEAQFLG